MANRRDPVTGNYYPVADEPAVNNFSNGVYTPVSAGAQASKDTVARDSGDANTVHIASAPAAGSTQSAQDYINKTVGTDAYIATQKAKLAAATASGDTSMLAKLAADSVRTGLSYAPAGSTQSAQDWINNSASGQGGVEAYKTKQIERLKEAQANGNTDLINKLNADSKRTGLDYSGGSQSTITDIAPVTDSGSGVGGGGTTGQTTNDLSSFKQSQTSLINDIYEKQRAAQLQKIKETRDIQTQGLNKVNVQAEDSATAQRGQIAAADIQAGNRLRESMAQMGLLNSGDNLTAQGNQNTIRQSAMGQTNQELARVKQDVSERQKMINDAAANNDLALLQQLQAQQAQDMLALGYKVNDNEYRDAVFGWQKQTDTANLTGNFQNQRTMQGQQFDYNKTIDQRNFDYGASRDTVLDNRYNQQFDYQKVQDDIKNGQWSTTTENQMKQWAEGNKLNWAQFDQTTKQALAQIAISQQNANTSSANSNASIGNMNADNARAAQNQLIQTWKLTGVAPAGLESIGVKPGDEYTDESQKGLDAQGTIAGDISKLTADPATAEANIKNYFNANASHFVPIITADAYEKMKQNALAPYTKITPVQSQDTSIRSKAISAAQNDPRFLANKKTLAELIPEYEALYN
jgi:hypothetical protein